MTDRPAPADLPADVVRIRLDGLQLRERPLPPGATRADVVDVLGATLREHAVWFVRSGDVAAARNRFAHVLPHLVTLSQEMWPDAVLGACVRAVVGNGGSVRNLARLLWLLLEAEPRSDAVDAVWLPEADPVESRSAPEQDPGRVASSVRRRTAFDAWQVGVDEAPQRVGLPRVLEDELLAGGDRGGAEWRILRVLAAVPPTATVVTHSPAALGPVQYLVRALPRVPPVIASHELPPGSAPPPELPVSPAAAGPARRPAGSPGRAGPAAG